MKLMRKTKLKGWYEFTKTPCPICGHTGGCIAHESGTVVACIRIESERPFSKDSALPSFLHYLNEQKQLDIKNTEIEEYQDNLKLDATVLNEIYCSLLNHLELEEEHYEHLISPSRKLSDRQIMLRNYKSFPRKPWETARDISEELALDGFTGVPGFYYKDNRYWTIAGTKGILIPYRNHYNQIVGYQYRIDHPLNVVEVKLNRHGLTARIKEQPDLVQVAFDGEIIFEQKIELGKKWITIIHGGDVKGWVRVVKGNRYYWLSSANKPQGTGSGNPTPIHVSIPSHKLSSWKSGTLWKARTVWLSEGALKCDIASDCIEKLYNPLEIEDIGNTFLALPGVGAWRLALPIMRQMSVEQVNLCFDADAVSNPQVKRHLLDCAKQLKQEGYKTNLVLWKEEDGKGIDEIFNRSILPHIKSLF